MSTEFVRVGHDDLRAFITRAFEAEGIPAPDAAKIANLMAEADLQGSDGHGVIQIGRAHV